MRKTLNKGSRPLPTGLKSPGNEALTPATTWMGLENTVELEGARHKGHTGASHCTRNVQGRQIHRNRSTQVVVEAGEGAGSDC